MPNTLLRTPLGAGKARTDKQPMRITVRVKPNAKVTMCTGWVGDDVFIIALHAPPTEGRANEELVAFLADTLDVPKTSISLVRGAGSREKVLDVPNGCDVSRLRT